VLLLGALAIAGIWTLRRARSTPEIGGYVVKAQESSLLVEKVDNHHRYTMSRDYLVEAKTPGVRLIDMAWYWTGNNSKPVQVRPNTPAHEVFDGRRPENDKWVYRWVYLGRALGKNEREKVGLTLIAEDDNEPMRHFFTIGARGTKVETLTLTLRFPLPERPNLVSAHIWEKSANEEGVIGDLPIESKADATSGTMQYKVEVNNPSAKRRYGFRWD